MLDGMPFDTLLLSASFFVLEKSSECTVNNSVKVTDTAGVGKGTIGFLLLFCYTTLPELFVAVFATGSLNTINISVGNVLGSVVANIILILGVCILYANLRGKRCTAFRGVTTPREFNEFQFGIFIVSATIILLVLLGYSNRLVGLALIAMFVLNTLNLSRDKASGPELAEVVYDRSLVTYIVLAVVGALGVVGSSYVLVNFTSKLAEALGVPTILIRATVIAFGTSIPELTMSLQACEGESINMALGNLIGSNFLNLTLIMGNTLALTDLSINLRSYTDLAVFAVLAN